MTFMEREDTAMPKASDIDSEGVDRSGPTDERAEPDRPEAASQATPRDDDRNDELPESPAPDPEEKEYPRPDDDPGAD
jgi:hypothetical protein